MVVAHCNREENSVGGGVDQEAGGESVRLFTEKPARKERRAGMWKLEGILMPHPPTRNGRDAWSSCTVLRLVPTHSSKVLRMSESAFVTCFMRVGRPTFEVRSRCITFPTSRQARRSACDS